MRVLRDNICPLSPGSSRGMGGEILLVCCKGGGECAEALDGGRGP